MAVDSLWEVTITMLQQNQQLNNVFYYVRDSNEGTPNAGDPPSTLSDFFGETILPALKARTSTTLDYRMLDVREVTPGFGFQTTTFAENNVGSQGSEALPIFVAAQFFSPRTVGNIRAGFKRFPGITESQQIAGNLTASEVTAWQAVAGLLSNQINLMEGPTLVGFLFPRIVKRIKEVDVDGKVSYRLPESLAELQTAGVNWNARENLTTQNSRKIGRGI